ncbi:MAG: ABC transporter ATP-binding protein [Deltaproteobacteria bacterium]|nr:ABC transporter ATP-binding protein [Deltaproteobacteria bacterium]
MILAEGLTKQFGAFTAIAGVSFQVGRGEIVGFLGPNGAGKSTTMRVLAGVFPPTAGRALVAGYDVVAQAQQARGVVGYFPERVSLYLDMTVRDYLTYVAEMKGMARAQAGRQLPDLLASCGLAQMQHRIIGTLSKGYRQRVGIAQALVGEPQVLILDEPTSGLDPEQVAEMRALIRRLQGERTVILSTHILSEVEATCDRVIIINKGRVLAVDTPRNLNQRLRRTSEIHLEVIGPAAEVRRRLHAIPGVLRLEPELEPAPEGGVVALTVSTAKECDLRADIAAAVTAAGWGLRELRPLTLSLEDIFLTMVSHSETPAETTTADQRQ